MFSLDVVRLRDKQQDAKRAPSRQLPQRNQSLRDERQEETRAALDNGDGGSTLPRVHQDQQAQQRDRRLKKLYGRTQKEMHDAYVERVGKWMQHAPGQQWARDYAKHTSYSKDYVPRERSKTKELGGPMLKTNLYSPRGVFKGGGECVRSLADGDPSAPPEEREAYRQAIRFIEKSREKDKEIQPPMSIPKNRSLECGHYFVEDVICVSDTTTSHQQQQQQQLTRPSSRKQLHPLYTDTAVPPPLATDHHHYDPPPTTAEYVAHPQWRVHSPERWMDRAFVSTVPATNAHTAQNCSITGTHYAQSVLTSETFVPPHKRFPLSPKDAALNPHDHDRRAQTAAAMLRETRSPRRHDRKYFSSMWTQPGSPSRAAPVTLDGPPRAGDAPESSGVCTPTGGESPSRNVGRVLAIQLHERASRGVPSPRRARACKRPTVLVRPLERAAPLAQP